MKQKQEEQKKIKNIKLIRKPKFWEQPYNNTETIVDINKIRKNATVNELKNWLNQ